VFWYFLYALMMLSYTMFGGHSPGPSLWWSNPAFFYLLVVKRQQIAGITKIHHVE